MKKVHLKDIAKDLNVSKTAVSLVLNNKGDANKISKETQEKIYAYAKEHNYVPNQLARGLSRGKSETIGLIIPNISDSFYAKIAESIEKKAKELGYTVIFSSTYEDPKKESELIESMLNRQVDGLIIASTQENQEDLSRLRRGDFPFVLIDRHYPESKDDCIVVDNFNGMRTATAHLVKLGRQSIGFVSLKPRLEAIRQRLLGYQSAISNLKDKESANDLIKELDRVSYKEEMEKAVVELLKFPNSADAIVFSTHYLAAEGLRTLKRLNVKVPRDVAIVSFDQQSEFDIVDPPITALVQPTNEMGNMALDILMSKIKSEDTVVGEARILQSEFIIRKSCGTI